jgi:4-aminobutyrate aminotransferase-like enzyme
VAACIENNLPLLTSGPCGNTIRFIPPLNDRETQVDDALSIVEGALVAYNRCASPSAGV